MLKWLNLHKGMIHLKIKISADSTCDLPLELIEKYNIGITPLYIVKDEISYKDGLEIKPEDIYEHAAKGGKLCSTAAVSVADYVEFFSKQREEYDAVIHFHISAEMSCCYQDACIAAAEIGNVYPVDSRVLSTGISILVLEAAEMAAQGKEPAEIVAAVEAMRDKLDVTFVVDTLEYLRKGGRCSALAAMGANLLSLKPCIEVKDGKMGVGKKYRGGIEKCFLQYIRERLEGREDIDLRRIFITHSGGGKLSPELFEELRKEILKYQSFEEVWIAPAGGTICCHCGPGTMGIIFARK